MLKNFFTKLFKLPIPAFETSSSEIPSQIEKIYNTSEKLISKNSTLREKIYRLEEENRKLKNLTQYYPREKKSIIVERERKGESFSSSILSESPLLEASASNLREASMNLIGKNIKNLKNFLENQKIEKNVTEYVEHILELMRNEIDYIALRAEQSYVSQEESKAKIEILKTKLAEYKGGYKQARKELKNSRERLEFLKRVFEERIGDAKDFDWRDDEEAKDTKIRKLKEEVKILKEKIKSVGFEGRFKRKQRDFDSVRI